MLPHYISKNPFFADLLQKTIAIPDQFYIPLFFINAILIFLIGKHFLEKKYNFLPPLVYLLTPWIYYENFAHSFYIFLLTLILITIYGAVRIEVGNKIIGSILFVAGFTASVYFSVPLLITLPLLFISLLLLKVQTFKNFKSATIVLLLLLIPLFFLILRNPAGFKNAFKNDVRIYSDPTLLNAINRYQGDAQETGFKNLGRISENRYLFFSEYFGLKYMNQLIPEVYFSPQYKLLGFSFEPPMFLGFIIPFIYGLYCLLKNARARKVLIISSLLAIPSVLANDLVSLNRLVLFSPVIIFIISFGLIRLYDLRRGKNPKIFLAITIILVFFQIIVTISDIKTRELQRFEKYYGQKYELTEP